MAPKAEKPATELPLTDAPAPETAAPETVTEETAAPADPFGIGGIIDTRYFPSPLLATGHRARRRAWAPGYELLVASAGGRTGQKLRLMTTGGRGGQVEWKPANMADELMADDWEAILTKPLAPPEEA